MWKLSIGLIFIVACAQSVSTEGRIQVNVADESTTDTVKQVLYEYGVDMLLGRFSPKEHEDYELIDVKFADRAGMYIHKDTYTAFREMYVAALEDSVKLKIRSATRNFVYQKGIWERKWNGETKVGGEDISKTIAGEKERALKILEYSSMPGTSRHHWGSDLDFNSFDNKWFESGEGRRLWDWLEENAASYGFCRPYTEKGDARPFGYEEERWHWSYMPLAHHFMSLAAEKHDDSLIRGFDGAETAVEIGVVEKYVMGVNADCK